MNILLPSRAEHQFNCTEVSKAAHSEQYHIEHYCFIDYIWPLNCNLWYKVDPNSNIYEADIPLYL